jgi:hypothetical protein
MNDFRITAGLKNPEITIRLFVPLVEPAARNGVGG